MNILICDDDKFVRFTLKRVLMEELNEEIILHEAINGKEFIKKYYQCKPDIAFVDIDMPVIDGLTAIEEVKKNDESDTVFIILTGHSDFSYAQKSVKLNVFDYILKPIESKVIIEVMAKVKLQLQKTLLYKNMDFKFKILNYFQLLNEIGKENVLQDSEYLGFAQNYKNLFGLIFFIDEMDVEDSVNDAYKVLFDKINSLEKEFIKNKIHLAVTESKEGNILLILDLEPVKLNSIKYVLNKLCGDMSTCSVRVTSILCNSNDLIDLYSKMRHISKRSYFRLLNSTDYVFTIHEEEISSREHLLLNIYNNLASAYLNKNKEEYKSILFEMDSLIYDWEREGENSIIKNVIKQSSFFFGVKSYICSWNQLHKFLIQLGRNMFSYTDDETMNIIDLATEYIKKNYMLDLSIIDIADKYHITPNYFSKLFHERNKITFVKYLTNVRIDNAKRLLVMKPDVLIKDIGIMVGYTNTRHFSNVFKKYTGMLPSSFRK